MRFHAAWKTETLFLTLLFVRFGAVLVSFWCNFVRYRLSLGKFDRTFLKISARLFQVFAGHQTKYDITSFESSSGLLTLARSNVAYKGIRTSSANAPHPLSMSRLLTASQPRFLVFSCLGFTLVWKTWEFVWSISRWKVWEVWHWTYL